MLERSLKAGFQPDASNATHATQGTCVKFYATHASHATQAKFLRKISGWTPKPN